MAKVLLTGASGGFGKLTANAKPLERRGLLTVSPDPDDKRGRRLALTDAGRDLLSQAVPIWRRTHDVVDRLLGGDDTDTLRGDLLALSFAEA